MKRVLVAILTLVLMVVLVAGGTVAAADAPSEGDTPAQSSLNTDYFTIDDPGGGPQPPMTYTDSQTHVTPAGILRICLQDVGVNPDPTPPSWADDIANIYVDGVYVGTYDSLNNPQPAPGPGPIQCFETWVGAGTHVILVEAVYSWVAGSMFAKEIEMSRICVDVDIKPGSWPNSINTKSKGVIPVAILGSAYFDVTTIDVTTLWFMCASPAHDLTDPDVYMDHLQDVNLDGYVDLVAHYRTQDVCPWPCPVWLTWGYTVDGICFAGMDLVRIVK